MRLSRCASRGSAKAESAIGCGTDLIQAASRSGRSVSEAKVDNPLLTSVPLARCVGKREAVGVAVV
jgi:hypothetical protein